MDPTQTPEPDESSSSSNDPSPDTLTDSESVPEQETSPTSTPEPVEPLSVPSSCGTLEDPCYVAPGPGFVSAADHLLLGMGLVLLLLAAVLAAQLRRP